MSQFTTDYETPILVYDDFHPKRSGNVHKTFDRHGRAWRSAEPPMGANWIPHPIVRHCFTRVRSLNLMPEHCTDSCLSDLSRINTVESIMVAGNETDSISELMLLHFPKCHVQYSGTLWGPLGTRAESSGEPCDAPQPRNEAF
ncbi:hypothetical protein [Rhodopirellula baltica]|uniref:hypothetical protein n=1 Tax=Rhodopirellula baltica TaxID=265606 RepID=UPI00056C4A71|nr:hypothetical protein [Rhodopirellula baltica]